jgi:hypothetical protein
VDFNVYTIPPHNAKICTIFEEKLIPITAAVALAHSNAFKSIKPCERK